MAAVTSAAAVRFTSADTPNDRLIVTFLDANRSTATVYYASSPTPGNAPLSATNNDGSLTPGQSITLDRATKWFIAAPLAAGGLAAGQVVASAPTEQSLVGRQFSGLSPGTLLRADSTNGFQYTLDHGTNWTELGSATVFNVKDARFAGGAKGDGVTDDTAAIQAAVTAAVGSSLVFPSATYLVNSAITGLASVNKIESVGATFTGAGATSLNAVALRLNTAQILQGVGGYNPDGTAIPNMVGTSQVALSTGGLYSDSGAGNIFHNATYVHNAGTRPTVAVLGFGKGAHAFGGNFVGYSETSSGVAVGIEIDHGNVGTGTTTVNGDQTLTGSGDTLTVADTTGAASSGNLLIGANSLTYTGKTGTTFTGVAGFAGAVANGAAVVFSVGGTAVGLDIVAIGGNVGGSPAKTHLQMAATIGSSPGLGIDFNADSGVTAIASTGTLIRANAERAKWGFTFAGSRFTSAAGYLPINSGSTTASQGLILAAEGGFANGGAALDIRSADAGSSVTNGIFFRVNGGIQPVTGSLISTSASFAATVGIDFSNATFSTAGIRMGDNKITTGTVTGTQIATATGQKLGFWGVTPVVRPAGWAAATGTATRSTFVTSTVTLATLAEHVKALTDDLITIGVIGA